MNPNSTSSPQPGLPQPSAMPVGHGSPTAVGIAPNPLAHLQAPVAGQSNQASIQSSVQQEALLKHTIDQARQIIASTGQDPFTQIQELERLKAAYINSRFGKNIKISDS